MRNSEIVAYKHMSTQDEVHVRRWLAASSVVATAFTAALVAIATNNFGRGLSSVVTQHAEATAVAASSRAVIKQP